MTLPWSIKTLNTYHDAMREHPNQNYGFPSINWSK